jgi:hypothetical protein
MKPGTAGPQKKKDPTKGTKQKLLTKLYHKKKGVHKFENDKRRRNLCNLRLPRYKNPKTVSAMRNPRWPPRMGPGPRGKGCLLAMLRAERKEMG